jgi:hypothetical protein
MPPRAEPSESAGGEARTGVPGLRTWRGVYAFVIGTFLAWLALLTWITLHYA